MAFARSHRKGQTGLGKSRIKPWLAAMTTKGGECLVDGTTTTQGNVVILSAEDDPTDTIRSRLNRVGADVCKVVVFEAALEGKRERRFSVEPPPAEWGSVFEVGPK